MLHFRFSYNTLPPLPLNYLFTPRSSYLLTLFLIFFKSYLPKLMKFGTDILDSLPASNATNLIRPKLNLKFLADHQIFIS